MDDAPAGSLAGERCAGLRSARARLAALRRRAPPRAARRAFMGLSLLLALGACGRRGALVLPEEEAAGEDSSLAAAPRAAL